jgi:glycosyltransferase involved in cell wall biosynthesis
MKILMLTPYLPYPPASGGQIRTLNLLKYLSKSNEITLIALYKNEAEKKYAKQLESYCKKIYLCKRAEKPWQINNILKSIFSLTPFLIVRNFSKEAKNTVEELLRKEYFDVIHAETFYIMPHIPKTKVPIFLLEQTIEYKVYQHYIDSLPSYIKYFFFFDILKLKYWERYYWRQAYLVGTVSETDKKMISKLEPQIKPVVIPNGAGDELIAYHLTKKDFLNPKILFLGNFAWLQNTEAASFLYHKILPKLGKKVSPIEVVIAGQKAKDKLKLKENNTIHIIDIDTDDVNLVKKIYGESTIFIAPIFGPGGTRLKILAAMATGLPVISTKTGVAGLLVKDGYHVLLAEDEDGFVEKIDLLLTNPALYEKLRTNAYKLVNEIYNWKKISHKLEIAYAKIKEL